QSAGVAIGPIFALMIGGAGASPPEVSMLAAVFKPRLLITFVATILTVAIIGGYLISLTS
ncbi:MAG: permease, partial [Candidatus Corynebacterium faecigallinarum]